MRSYIKDGKLVPPQSYSQGYERYSFLAAECARIALQIVDQTRSKLFAYEKDYEEWKTGARQALENCKTERRLLMQWIEEQERDLFKRSYDLLKTLRNDEVPFDEKETELLARLDEHFKTKEQ
jgi:hypothetical protein